MKIVSDTASVIGSSNPTVWGQILNGKHGHAVVEVSGEEQEAAKQGITLLGELEKILANPQQNPEDLKKISADLRYPHVVTMILCIPVGKILYITLSGEGGVYLKRGNNVAVLLSGEGFISGEVREKDTLILASKTLSAYIKDCIASFDHLPAEEAAEKLTYLINSQHAEWSGAALIYQVSSLEEEPVETTELPEVKEQPIRRRIPVWMSRRVAVRVFHDIRNGRIPYKERMKEEIRTITSNKRRVLSAVFICCAVIFLLSVVLGIRKQVTDKGNRETSAVLTEARHAFEEGVALRDLNTIKSRERFKEALKVLDAAIANKTVPPNLRREVDTLRQDVADNLSVVSAERKVTPSLFFDAELLKKGASVKKIARVSDTLIILDTSARTVIALSVADKSGRIIGGGEYVQGTSLITGYDNRAYLFSDNGIFILPFEGKADKKPVIAKNEGWGKIAAMSAFAGNLYLLDSGKNRIWKYMAVESGGFSDMREYLRPDTLPDFSGATDMQINGSVWVSTSTLGFLRFTQGMEETFVPTGIEGPELGKNLSVYTSDDTERVYVLDNANKRVVVFGKDGIYQSQYVWEGEISPTALAVYEKEKIILLVSAGKIYSFALQ